MKVRCYSTRGRAEGAEVGAIDLNRPVAGGSRAAEPADATPPYLLVATLALLLGGCTMTTPSPDTLAANQPQLRTGRALFVARCIECHSLPNPQKYTRAEWPHLVDKMSARASLSPAERNAIVAYVKAAARP